MVKVESPSPNKYKKKFCLTWQLDSKIYEKSQVSVKA